MKKFKPDSELDSIFHALADGTRRDILARLAENDYPIKVLAENYDMTLAAVSKHIRVLEKAKFVETTKEGRVHKCKMNFEPLKKVELQVEFFKQFWTDQFDAIETYLKKKKEKNDE